MKILSYPINNKNLLFMLSFSCEEISLSSHDILIIKHLEKSLLYASYNKNLIYFKLFLNIIDILIVVKIFIK